ncbi:MAG: hypothetical protein HEQ32_02915 [Vampirovibrio sp.]
MSSSLFQFDATLPLVFLGFLVFAQVMRVVFFEPIQRIKKMRVESLDVKNKALDLTTAWIFEHQNLLQEEESKTQQLVQAVYQERAKVAQETSAKTLHTRKEELGKALSVHVAAELERLNIQKEELGQQKEALMAQITQKLLH